MAFGSWPFSHPPTYAKLSKLGQQVFDCRYYDVDLRFYLALITIPIVQTENKIVYGHTLHVGTGAGQYSSGGLVTHLAFGGNLDSSLSLC